MRRRAADCSFGLGWRPEWTSMTKAELTAENSPAYKNGSGGSQERTVGTTYEDQGGVEVLVVLLDVVCIILDRLPLVHRVEIEAGVVVLDGLEECPESILEATFIQRYVVEAMHISNVPLWIDLQWSGVLFDLFSPFPLLVLFFHQLLRVVQCDRRILRME